ncbi:uncharacterized protein LOC129884988 isoform X2 [Solanum dulcamara]|uniref:uncharacterized protein LOC129884988 isoform X2 n=1 Tax=Solanum dulcamara TaxID=45834 RepID=UPI0024854D36|nr:uncharacterized protein LOC129884988 isoform X2 [Solanum dulcamara]
MLKQSCVLNIGYEDKKIVMDQTPMRMKLQWNFSHILLNLAHIDREEWNHGCFDGILHPLAVKTMLKDAEDCEFILMLAVAVKIAP